MTSPFHIERAKTHPGQLGSQPPRPNRPQESGTSTDTPMLQLVDHVHDPFDDVPMHMKRARVNS